jgi:AcrR family transcriptional regulator
MPPPQEVPKRRAVHGPRSATAAGPRRRRSRQEAEGEILAAAAALLRERPLHEVGVSAIMERTTLSRKSFYVYFRDRYELLTRLFAPIRRELDALNTLFLAPPGDDVVGGARQALEAIATFFAGKDGALVRALHEASAYDKQAASVWREFNEPVIAAFTEQIRRQRAAQGIVDDLDAEAAVRALVGMNLYSFFDQVVGKPKVDVEAIAETLFTIWVRTFLAGSAGAGNG